MHCKQCGKEYRQGAKYCRNCGYKLINYNNSSPNSINSVSETYSQADLINLSLSGNENAFNLLVKSLEPMARFYARSITNDDYLASESVQLANIQMYRSLSSLKEIGSFEGWYKKIVRNKALDLLKKSNKEINFTSLDTDDSDFEYNIADEKIDYQPELMFDRNEKQKMINEIISSLDDNQKVPIMMYFYEGLKIKEIAEELSIPESTVKTRLTAGKKKIKDKVIDIQSRYDIKLYSLSPLSLFLWLLNDYSSISSVPSSLLMAGSSVTKASSLSSVAATKAVSSPMLSNIGNSVITKIVVGSLLVSGSVGAGYYAVNKLNNSSDDDSLIEENDSYIANENQIYNDGIFEYKADSDPYTIDPFSSEIFDKEYGDKGVIVGYTGISPSMIPVFHNYCDPNTIESKIRYYVKKGSDSVYKNDDVITIIATFSDTDITLDETVFNSETYSLERNEISYRLDTGVRGITDFDDISDKQWQKLYEEVVEYFEYTPPAVPQGEIYRVAEGVVAKYLLDIPCELLELFCNDNDNYQLKGSRYYIPGIVVKITDYISGTQNVAGEWYCSFDYFACMNKDGELVEINTLDKSFVDSIDLSAVDGEETKYKFVNRIISHSPISNLEISGGYGFGTYGRLYSVHYFSSYANLKNSIIKAINSDNLNKYNIKVTFLEAN